MCSVTSRGCRAGQYKQRLIKTITRTTERKLTNTTRGVNFDNLANLTCVENCIKTLVTSRPDNQKSVSNDDFSRMQVLVPVSRTSQNARKLKLRCALWNSRSLNGKVSGLSSVILEDQLDIIFLTETWLTGKNDPIITEISASISDFNFYQVSRSSRRGGGVGILARSNLSINSKREHNFRSFQCLEVAFRCGSCVLRTLTIYRPPESKKNTSTKKDFLDEFSVLLETLNTLPGYLVLCGDFNLHVDNCDDRYVKQFLETLDLWGLQQHVKSSTHDKGHILDLIITRSSDEIIREVCANNDLPSDHCFIQFGLNISRPPNKAKTVTFRKLKSINISEFKEHIAQRFQDDLQLHEQDSTEAKYNRYKLIINTILDELAPTVTKTIIDKPRAPWYCGELAHLRQEVRQCERKWNTSGLEVHHEIFVSKRYNYFREVDKTKQNYHKERIQEADTKGLFRIIDQLSTGKSVGITVIPTNIPQNQVCDAFADFFH
ncbi:hypothetical protein SNE40_013035 [Patella caerulea]|uniref:Endonuclease/exonuclease/phosphatase domain-containing protein n=1 Tax=Patella caerulea TaxID=87958 RepID=A0AAN8PT42_PATCE